MAAYYENRFVYILLVIMAIIESFVQGKPLNINYTYI